MIKEVTKKLKSWVIREYVDSLTNLLSENLCKIDDLARSLDLRVKQLEDAEKSRAEIMDFVASSAEELNPVCNDCVSMRLELDALRIAMDEMKSRIEAIEAAGKSSCCGRRTKNTQIPSTASELKPKRGRRNSNATKELDS